MPTAAPWKSVPGDGLGLEKPYLLLLDEPANNLDIPPTEVLESALEGFEAAIRVISHDRSFLDRLVDWVGVLASRDLSEILGGYSDSRERFASPSR